MKTVRPGYKYCYVYTREGALVDHNTVSVVAKKHGLSIKHLYCKISTCTLINNEFFVTYKSDFSLFLKLVKDKYELSEQESALLRNFTGNHGVFNISENSFAVKEMFHPDESMYGEIDYSKLYKWTHVMDEMTENERAAIRELYETKENYLQEQKLRWLNYE